MSTNTALDDIKSRTEGHTEGPWAWAGTPARRELSGKGGDVLACATLLWPDTADAELTAAAPKLLAALEAVEELCVLSETVVDGRSRAKPNFIHPDVIRRAIQDALS